LFIELESSIKKIILGGTTVETSRGTLGKSKGAVLRLSPWPVYHSGLRLPVPLGKIVEGYIGGTAWERRIVYGVVALNGVFSPS
jgi:hypothetical protein